MRRSDAEVQEWLKALSEKPDAQTRDYAVSALEMLDEYEEEKQQCEENHHNGPEDCNHDDCHERCMDEDSAQEYADQQVDEARKEILRGNRKVAKRLARIRDELDEASEQYESLSECINDIEE